MSTERLMICERLEKPAAPYFHLACTRLDHGPANIEDWCRIQQAADQLNDISEATFDASFGGSIKEHQARIFYLLNDRGQVFATSAAWYGEPLNGDLARQGSPLEIDSSWGRVHWVAVHPHFQGKGMGNLLMSITITRLMELGHEKAYLTTDVRRPGAMRLYEKFGFKAV